MLVLNLGNLFLMPLALAHLFDKSAMAIGLMIAPGAILSTFLTRFVGRWIDRYGNVRFLLIGQCVIAAVLLFFTARLAASPLVVLCGYLLFSPAFSASMASCSPSACVRLEYCCYISVRFKPAARWNNRDAVYFGARKPA